MPRIQIVIFDVDGTLIDESASLEAQTGRVAWKFGDGQAERQRVVDAFFRANDEAQRLLDAGEARVKGDIPWYMRRMGEYLGIPVNSAESDTLARDWSEAYHASHHSPVLFDDSRGVLERLSSAGYRLVVASGNTVETRRRILGGVGIEGYFEAIHAAIDEGFQKQDVRFWTGVVTQLGVAADRVAVVGNQVNDDIMHPVALGMVTFLVRRPDRLVKNLGPTTVQPTHVVETLEDVPRLLRCMA